MRIALNEYKLSALPTATGHSIYAVYWWYNAIWAICASTDLVVNRIIQALQVEDTSAV